MGCTEVGHSHPWPTSGTLIIQRCEIRCNFCTGEKALKEWKYAWFLRRHVRAVHCKSGNRKAPYDLAVSTEWTENSANGKKKSKAVKKESTKNSDDEDSSQVDDGMAAKGEISMGADWIEQPFYEDAPNQHPGEGTARKVGYRDVDFGQDLVLGNQDHRFLMENTEVLSSDEINTFLEAQSESFVQFIGDQEVPLAQEANSTEIGKEAVTGDNDDDDTNANTKNADLVVERSATYFGLDENGDAVERPPFPGHDFSGSDRFFMPEISDNSDFGYDDVPLASMSSISHPSNNLHPPAHQDNANVFCVLQETTKAMREQGVSSGHILQTMQEIASEFHQRAVESSGLQTVDGAESNSNVDMD